MFTFLHNCSWHQPDFKGNPGMAWDERKKCHFYFSPCFSCKAISPPGIDSRANVTLLRFATDQMRFVSLEIACVIFARFGRAWSTYIVVPPSPEMVNLARPTFLHDSRPSARVLASLAKAAKVDAQGISRGQRPKEEEEADPLQVGNQRSRSSARGPVRVRVWGKEVTPNQNLRVCRHAQGCLGRQSCQFRRRGAGGADAMRYDVRWSCAPEDDDAREVLKASVRVRSRTHERE